MEDSKMSGEIMNEGTIEKASRIVASSHESGKKGELDIISKVSCPNCGKKLMLLPDVYPMMDVQCTACYFRAQIKHEQNKPSDRVFGAGWEIMEKNLKSGHQIPPLIVNSGWNGGQEIRFYPFILKKNLKVRSVRISEKRPNYKMFNYVGLRNLPHFILYKK